MQLDTCGLIGLCLQQFSSCHGCAVQLVDSFHCSVLEWSCNVFVLVLNVFVSNLNVVVTFVALRYEDDPMM